MTPEENKVPVNTEEKVVTASEPDPASSLKQIRTFQGDVASALAKQKESLFSIQERERQKYAAIGVSVPRAPQETSNLSRSFLVFAVGGFFLLALAGLAGYYSYTEFVRRTTPPEILEPSNQFVSVESEIKINLSTDTDKVSLSREISNAASDNPADSLRHILIFEEVGSATPIKTSRLFALAGFRGPGYFARSLSDDFMLGSVGDQRFLILKSTSYENAYSGTLAWEKNMIEDIGSFFLKAGAVQNIAASFVFKDTVYENKDVRAVFVAREEGKEEIVLLYSFFDNEIVIITESVEALRTLVERLTREKLKR